MPVLRDARYYIQAGVASSRLRHVNVNFYKCRFYVSVRCQLSIVKENTRATYRLDRFETIRRMRTSMRHRKSNGASVRERRVIVRRAANRLPEL